MFQAFVNFAAMENTRLNKLERLLQKDLGEILRIESRNLFHGAMITVTKVRITNDLSIARIYLSIFAAKDKEAIVAEVKLYSKKIKSLLAQKIKNQVRKIPELEFYLDDSLDYIENIDRLLND